jgi:hypothetical protein
MSIQIIGGGGVIADVDGSTYNALKVTSRPPDYGLRGSYRLGLTTGTINATLTNGSLFQFFWPSFISNALVWGVSVDYNGASSNVNFQVLKLMFERYVTALGTGGTLFAVAGTTGQSQQLRTSMRSSLASQIRIATTAALGNGTWTEDANAIGSLTFTVDSTGINRNVFTGLRLYGNLSKRTGAPIVLSANEALNVNLTTTTTPTFMAGVNIAWSEVGAY